MSIPVRAFGGALLLEERVWQPASGAVVFKPAATGIFKKEIPAQPSPLVEKSRPEKRHILIETKILPPQKSPHLLPVPRLEEKFEAALSRQLICLIAPAGYGKTTTLLKQRAFIESRGIPCGWINLDREDNTPIRFLHYVISALQRAMPDFGRATLAQMKDDAVPMVETLLLSLCDDLARIDGELALFLDDYHVIQNEAVHDVMNWLIKNCTHKLKFVIASRTQLPFRLSKLRLAQRIHEMQAEDLNLHLDEAGDFIRTIAGRELAASQITLLYERTEGWIAGLLLASLALKEIRNVDAFVEEFSGSDRDIATYLFEIVVSQLSPQIQEFLASTSLFNRFSAEFCRDVLQEDEAAQLIEWIEAHNLFVVALDRRRQWYRYHNLFADFLRERFILSAPDEVKSLYRAASSWFEQTGAINSAIRYALEGQHYVRAADLIAKYAYELTQLRGKHTSLLKWAAALPQQYVERRPEIKLPCIWALIFTQHYREVEDELARMEWLLAPPRDSGSADGKEAADINARRKALMIQSIFYAMTDRVARAEKIAREWLARWENSEPYDVANMQALLGYGAYINHDYEGAKRLFTTSRVSYGRCTRYSDGVAWTDTFHAMVELEQGNIGEAERVLVHGLQLNSEKFSAYSYGSSLLSLLHVQVCYEKNSIGEAERILEGVFPFAKGNGFIETSQAAYLSKARILFLRGHADDADTCLAEGIHAAERLGLHRLARMLSAERIHLLIKSGQGVRAAQLARSIGFMNEGTEDRRPHEESADDIGIRLVDIRLQLATDQTERTHLLLGDLLANARRHGRKTWIIKLLCLRAMLQVKRGSREEARRSMDEALEIGADGGHRRVFADEGVVVAQLIQEIADRRMQLQGSDAGSVPLEYVMQVLHACGERPSQPFREQPVAEEAFDLIRNDAFSEREIQILKLVESGMGNRDMASKLFLSEATVKWHLQNVYTKLGVNKRTSAIARARELSLLSA